MWDDFPYKLILGSASPRRRELLQALALPFEVRVLEVEENFPATLAPREVALYLGRLKATAHATVQQSYECVLTADTVVGLGNTVLNKPANSEEAVAMLKQLSNKTHTVTTAVGISAGGDVTVWEDTARVTFRELSDKEIAYYVNHHKPFDKAGGYGIQEWIGMVGITRLEGSYYTVMGLPVHLVYERLQKMINA